MSLENSPDFLLNFSRYEMNGEDKHFYRFKSFRLDVAERQLFKNGVSVPLMPKVFDALVVLVERSGHLVEKEELLRIVWSDSFVEEANIARIIHMLRRTLGENEKGNKFIETVAKKGYRFVAEVTEVSEPIAQKSTDEKQNDLNFVENSNETNLQIPPPEIDETGAAPEAKPKQKMRLILFGVCFMSAVSLIFLFSFNYSSNSSVNPNEIKSIAVLPLKSLTAENRDAIYELGIADSLILTLSQVKNLRVRSLSATQSYADAQRDAVAAGREQKVDYVLASNYQIADGKIRITSQLINVSTGAVEEIFKNEQNVADGFAVQDAVAMNISRKLLAKLNREPSNPAAKRYPTSEEAYRLYLQGRALADRRNRKDAEKAVEYLEQAVRLDPNYAPAYAQLANAYMASGMFGGDLHRQYPKQKAAIEKALAMDENLAEAYSYLGEMKMNYEWDFDGAERAHRRAVELDPKSGAAHRMYALYLSSMGRADEAIAEIKIAIDLEPALPLNQQLYGQFLTLARRYDEALPQLKRSVEIDPNFRTNYGWLIRACLSNGENDKAFEWFLRAPHRKDEPPEKLVLWKEIYAKSGWRGIRLQQLEEAKAKEKSSENSYWELVLLYLDLGDKEQAIARLEENFQKGGRGWRWTTLKIDEKYDSIRSDPRFEEIVRRVGLK